MPSSENRSTASLHPSKAASFDVTDAPNADSRLGQARGANCSLLGDFEIIQGGADKLSNYFDAGSEDVVVALTIEKDSKDSKVVSNQGAGSSVQLIEKRNEGVDTEASTYLQRNITVTGNQTLDLSDAGDEPEIREDGLELVLPPVSGIPATSLRYPWAGRSLFGAAHVKTAQHLLQLMAHADASRDAYDRGVAEERGRIARDMHDNIGAPLLHGFSHIISRLTIIQFYVLDKICKLDKSNTFFVS